MRKPQSIKALTDLGRVQLSPSFFMRDFLYSEIANFHQLQNIPDNPDLAIRAGTQLCVELLEPLNATFGRIEIRSAYRSPEVNKFGNENKLGCANNKANRARHIWDEPDDLGMGAMACVVVPWFMERYTNGADWRAMAYWIHNHLPYSELEFFPTLCAFNIGWHEVPQRTIRSRIPNSPVLDLPKGAPPDPAFASYYAGFPELRLA